MNDPKTTELAFKAEVQKKLISNCLNNLHIYFRSRKWELLAHKFRSLGYQLPKDLISCKICDSDLSAYYFYKQKKIVLCANNVLDADFNQEVTHQVINAFDDARAEIDTSNRAHIACSTVRGVNLSEKCAKKKIFGFVKQKGEYAMCVRDKAIREMMKFKDFGLKKDEAEEVVCAVWDTCYYDYEPYTLGEFKTKNN